MNALARIVRHSGSYKSMALLGPAAFGRPCGTCGRPRTSTMLQAHRDAANALLKPGRTVDDLAGVCHCDDEKAAA